MVQLAQQLRELGFQITSHWLDEPHGPKTKLDDLTPAQLNTYADHDLADIRAADWLVFFSQDPNTATVRGGRHVEFGYALALGKHILIVGPRENLFHFLPEVRRTSSWKEAKSILKKERSLMEQPAKAA
jgi:nucleoside 2-deoxyribosyltransferase